MAWLIFMDWVISWANECEGYFNYFRKEVEISRNWVTAHFLIFDGQSQNCQGACEYIIQLTCYKECIMRVKVYWKSSFPPSWTQLFLTSFVVPFKGCALPTSFLFHIHSMVSQISFSVLKILCILPLHPSFPPNPPQPLILLRSLQFCLLQKVIHS